MNFDEAIKAHAEWKMKLTKYLQKPDRSLDPNAIRQDNQCALGRWLEGEGKTAAHLPEFAQLKVEHTNFHRSAADIVVRADRGEKVLAEVALGGNSPYASASTHVTQLLMTLRRHY